jgi:hypothetical protein
MPQHGQERNRRTETTLGAVHTLATPGGSLTMPITSKTETVTERWCEICQEWITARGIMGGLLCVECGTTW